MHADGGAEPPHGLRTLTLVPHLGHVHVCKNFNMITHLTLQKWCKLPEGGPYDLHFDDDGFGALVEENGDRVFCLEDCLPWQLYKSERGDFVVCEKKSDGERTLFNFSGVMKSYEQHTVTLDMKSNAGYEFTVFKMEYMRGGCKMLWACKEFYELLECTSYKGQSSKWVYSQLGQWEKTCNALGGSTHFLKSVGGHLTPEEVMKSSTHVLPFTSMTSVALIALLARWAKLSPRLGGAHGRSKYSYP